MLFSKLELKKKNTCIELNRKFPIEDENISHRNIIHITASVP